MFSDMASSVLMPLLIRIPFDHRRIHFANLTNQPPQNKDTQIYTQTRIHVPKCTCYRPLPTSELQLSAILTIDNVAYQWSWDKYGRSINGNSENDLIMFIWSNNHQLLTVPAIYEVPVPLCTWDNLESRDR